MNFRKVFPNEQSDESVYVFVRPYYLAFLPWFVIILGLLIIGIIFFVFTLSVFPGILADPTGHDILVMITSAYLLLIVSFLTVAFINYYYDIYLVTDRRLVDIDQISLFHREINELALEEVQDVTTKNQGIFSSLFDYGMVIIETAAAREKFVFNSVLHPREISTIILDLSDQAKKRLETDDSHLTPRGKVKGVINGRLYNSMTPLRQMGAVVPSDPTRNPHSGASQPPDLTAPADNNPPSRSVSTTENNDSDGLDIIIDDPDS